MNKFERAEAVRHGKRVFRARHTKNGAFTVWWEGIAKDCYDAIKQANKSYSNSYPKEYTPLSEFEVREYTKNGGWKKVERG